MEFPKAKPLIPMGRSLDDLREAPVEVRRAFGGALRVAQLGRARVDLAVALTQEIRGRGLTQTKAAEILGVTQPDISNLMRGNVDGFSQERLERLLNALDLDVRIQVGPKPAGQRAAGVRVERVSSFIA